MRLSVLRGDPGYHSEAWRCKVRLDGKEVKRCLTADEERGEVTCFKSDSDGNMYFDPKDPHTIQWVTLYGKVKIVVPLFFNEYYAQETNHVK